MQFEHRGPHPYPLPRERETSSSALENSVKDDVWLHCRMFLPLLWGEGRGEGEVRVQLHRPSGHD